MPATMTFISEIVKIGLLSSVSLAHCRELAQLKEDNESGLFLDLRKDNKINILYPLGKQFLNLQPEVLLLRWVNYHLKRAGGRAAGADGAGGHGAVAVAPPITNLSLNILIFF